MSNKIGGFFVPGSIKGSYVASKKNEEGSYKYDTQAIGVGMQKQAALQELEKSYESTINNAYNSYLANQQTIRTSNMGQGYKEIYEQAENENLLAQQAEAAMNVSQVKSQLLGQEQEAQASIQQQYQTEVANLDRVARSMQDYLGYIKSLEGGIDYLSKLSGINVTNDTLAEDLYEALYDAQPQALSSAEDSDIKGMSYSEWLHSQMKETDEDVAFERWLFSGGWQDFQKSAGIATDTTEAGEKYAEIKRQREETRAKIIQERRDAATQKRSLEDLDKIDFNVLWGETGKFLNNAESRKALSDKFGVDLSNAKHSQRFKDPLGNEIIFTVSEDGKWIYVRDQKSSGEVSRLL